MNMRYAIFDMDGTLINSLIIWDVIWESIGKEYLHDASFRPTKEDDRRVRTMTLLDAMEYIAGTYHIGTDGETLNRFVSDLCLKFYETTVEMKEGAHAFLDACKRNGVRMCIASATEMSLVRAAMKHLKLEPYFDDVFSCAAIGKGKDQPDIYLAALDYFGAKPSEAWVFEDSAVALVTAKGVGMHTVGLYDVNNYGQDILRREADHYIAEGETLLRLVEDNLL